MSLIPNMRGKSWAMLHSLFQNWLVQNFPPESIPDSETCLLMWAAWRESHELTRRTSTKPVAFEPIIWCENDL